jgi:superfamily II DNA or RNA helicase
MTNSHLETEKKIAIYGALQNYKILSYKTFYKKVLGEKISEKKIIGDKKIKTSYKKNEEGDIEREIVVDKITNMDNSLLIVDEAHNLTGNEYGEALKKIIKNSKNLKVILLTATPMKNLADDIIDILNFLKPLDNQIKRDKVFTNDKNYKMQFKPGGKEYLSKMVNGYVSYFRGSMPYTFAKRVDKGDILPDMLFTPVIRCMMHKFQLKYYKITKANIDDTLDRASSSAANFIYPGLNSNNRELLGFYSTDGLNKVISQILTNKKELINLINKDIFKGKINKDDINNFIDINDSNNITGKILHLKYLKPFSVKFYKCIKRLSKLVEGYKGTGTAFIYSNLVKAGGMELFAESLIINGYLEYKMNPSDYNITDNTLDSRTGKSFGQFKKEKINLSDFNPATFLIVTGGDDAGDEISEVKQKIIREVFNNADNKNGKMIKFVLGSKVMTEGVTLENVKETHILDVHYNLGKVHQVIGRAIRMCKHSAVINDNNRFPTVNVYRYVVSLDGELSSDENLYRKAELKYLLVKNVERVLKESAIDCPILMHGNKFPEEIKKYKGCVPPTLENKKKGKLICPEICDFQSCDYKCIDDKLNKIYDDKKGTYKNLDVKEIDYNTFTNELAKSEVIDIKNKIKDLYRFKHVYTYDELLDKIKVSFSNHQSQLFNKKFLDLALHQLIPKSENDYNNYIDTIYDKYNKTGYIIQRNKYYIFQPFDDNQNIDLNTRQKIKINSENMISIQNYYIQKHGSDLSDTISNGEKIIKKKSYDFESTNKYYSDRDENFIVGIIDINTNKNTSTSTDLFKIRPPINKDEDKKRGTGIYSLKGAVCSTSKDRNYLLKMLTKLQKMVPNVKIKSTKKSNRINICNEIRLYLLYLEKYSTSKDKNKNTYIIIPADHPTIIFPYNLEDRVKHILNQVKSILQREYDYKVIKGKDSNFDDFNLTTLPSYVIDIKINKYIESNMNKLLDIGFKKSSNKLIFSIH